MKFICRPSLSYFISLLFFFLLPFNSLANAPPKQQEALKRDTKTDKQTKMKLQECNGRLLGYGVLHTFIA